MISLISSYGNYVNDRKRESGFYILCFCPHILHATNWWECGIEIYWYKVTMMLWHLQIRNLNLMLGKLKDYFINHLCFSSRLTGLTLMMLFQKTSRVSVPAIYPQILVSKLICFQNFANVQKYFFRAAGRFSWLFSDLQIIFMYLTTVLFETGNIIKLLFFFFFKGGRVGVRVLYHALLPNMLFLPSWLYGQLHMEYQGIS